MTTSIGGVSAFGSTSVDTVGSGSRGVDSLGKQEFLRLLTAQLRNQDPLHPMEDKEFITQLAQFSSLEAIQNLDKQLQEFVKSQALGQSSSLIGKQVTATLDDGTSVSGLVSGVRLIDGAPQFVIAGKLVLLGQITSIGTQPV